MHSMDVLAAQLNSLPDNVKRHILARMPGDPQSQQPSSGGAAVALPPAPAFDEAQPPDGHATAAARIATRRVLIPPMQAGACVVDGCLSTDEVQSVAAAVAAWLAKHGRRAGMGGSSSGGLWHDPGVRGDINCWATPQEMDAAGQPLLAAVLQLLASLREGLAAQGFDTAGRCSCQLVCYPGNGARYVRHTDASDSAPERSITALLYLNPEWDVQADGGQLALYNAARSSAASGASSNTSSAARDSGSGVAGYLAGEPALLVPPLGGRLLVFDSRLEHEVLPAHRTRHSITAFFYRGTAQPGAGDSHPATVAAVAAAPAPTPARAAAAAEPPPVPVAHAGAVCASRPGTAAAPAGRATEAHAAAGAASSPGPPASAPAAGMAAQRHAETPVSSSSSSTGLPSTNTTNCSGSGSSSSSSGLPRIFVSIPAFRDEECQWTLRDLFVKAAHPGRVVAGVVWQVDPAADSSFVRMAGGARTAPFLKQVREVRLHCSTATGPCAARSMAQRLWAGEEYVLHIDAHTRFVQDWDVLCLSELRAAQQAAGSDKVVLSTYPLGYTGHGAAAALPSHAPATLLCAKGFDEAGMLHIMSRSLRCQPMQPLPSHFWAAGFSFAPCAWLWEVPYCPHLPHLFFGEEQHMLLRMMTRGWRVWAPTQALVFHQWERSARPTSFQACVQVDAAARAASQARVLQLSCQHGDASSREQLPPAVPGLGAGGAAPCCMAAQPKDEDWGLGGVWGLGTERPLREFEEAAGVTFSSRTVQSAALYGGQPKEAFAGGEHAAATV